MKMQIKETALRSILLKAKADLALEEVFDRINSPEELVTVFGRLVVISSVFAPCIAQLAGKVGTLTGAFKQKRSGEMFSDIRADIAAKILRAATDEFGGSTGNLACHRTLAYATLKGIVEYYRIRPSKVDRLIADDGRIQLAIRRVCEGYGLYTQGAIPTIRAMGFHLGSEMLADSQGKFLHEFLLSYDSTLVSKLRVMNVRIVREDHNAYAWIEGHRNIEEAHWKYALEAVNMAIAADSVPNRSVSLTNLVKEGFIECSRLPIELAGVLLD